MARPSGLAKTGGRKRGTPNKSTWTVVETLQKLECNPIEGLARMAMDPGTSAELKVRCYAELAHHVYPKRKAIEFADEENDSGIFPLILDL